MVHDHPDVMMTFIETGVLNTFLSWNFFIPLGRLTYLNYLIHPLFVGAFMYKTPVQFYATDYFAVSNGLTIHTPDSLW